MRDGEMHVTALVGTAALAAALIVPMAVLSTAKSVEANPFDKMEVIEASLAMKKNTKVVQPQKPMKDPEPTVKPEGVSHDADKKPPEEKPKKDEPKKVDDKTPDLSKFKHATDDDDAQVGKKQVQIGDLNGSEFGDSATSIGDPWMGKLKADMHYAPPEIAKGDSVPVGCILLDPDGKIKDSKFKVETNDDLQTAAEAALKQLMTTRNAHPDPVPTHLLRLTEHYICFKFTVKS